MSDTEMAGVYIGIGLLLGLCIIAAVLHLTASALIQFLYRNNEKERDGEG